MLIYVKTQDQFRVQYKVDWSIVKIDYGINSSFLFHILTLIIVRPIFFHGNVGLLIVILTHQGEFSLQYTVHWLTVQGSLSYYDSLKVFFAQFPEVQCVLDRCNHLVWNGNVFDLDVFASANRSQTASAKNSHNLNFTVTSVGPEIAGLPVTFHVRRFCSIVSFNYQLYLMTLNIEHIQMRWVLCSSGYWLQNKEYSARRMSLIIP